MIINFVYNRKEVLRSVRVVRSFVDDFKNSRMFYIAPPVFSIDSPEFERDIIVREEKNNPLKIKQQLEKKFKIQQNKITTALKEYADYNFIKLMNDYKCVLTFYGPHGYYKTPKTIFLNISKGNCEFMLETVLHELLHLLLEKDIASKSSSVRENKVDNVFIKLWGDIFPNYKVQAT